MNLEQDLSIFLKRLVDTQVISESVAKEFNVLSSESLQLQAVKEWPTVAALAAKQLAGRLSAKDVNVLYDSRTADSRESESNHPARISQFVAPASIRPGPTSLIERLGPGLQIAGTTQQKLWAQVRMVARQLPTYAAAAWKRASLTRKITVGLPIFFLLSGFGVFHAISVPFVWLYQNWHMPFIATHAQPTVRPSDSGLLPAGMTVVKTQEENNKSKLVENTNQNVKMAVIPEIRKRESMKKGLNDGSAIAASISMTMSSGFFKKHGIHGFIVSDKRSPSTNDRTDQFEQAIFNIIQHK